MDKQSHSRLSLLNSQLVSSATSSMKNPISLHAQNVSPVKMVGDGNKEWPEIVDHKPSAKIKLDYHNKQGWGYEDSAFILDP